MKTISDTSKRVSPVVTLGRAKDLTKASFSGTQVEMIPEKLYQRGG